MSSDERLARHAAVGDERALAAIYRRYSQSLYRFCLAIVGNPEDAQDALQNTMVKVLRSLPGEKRRIELKPWLYRIAHNESVELLRRRRPSEELEPEQAAPRGADLAEDVAVRERLRRLIADLGQLPERQRGALVMRELSGLDYEEIAVALGTSPAVARQALYEARLSLHQMDAGREMDCDVVTRALSDADGRVTRRRDIRAHLRACPDCRRFRAALEGRSGDLAALAPLPALAAAGLLQGLLGGGAGAGAGAGAAGATGAGGAASLGTAAALKSAAAVAVVAVVGVGAADRAGVMDVAPFGGDRGEQTQSEERVPPPSPAPSTAPAAAGVAAGGNGAAIVPKASVVRDGTRAGAAPRIESGRGTNAPRPGGSATTGPAATVADDSHPHGGDHPKQHPNTAEHGQQTAAAHKAGGKGSGRGGGRSGQSHPGHPAQPSKPVKEPKASKPVKPPKPAQAAEPEPPAGGKAKAPKQTPGAEPAPPAPPEPSPDSSAPQEAPDKGSGSAFQP